MIHDLAMPHFADEDDEYNGYLIPKGATVLGNVFAIHMDPVRYPEPHVFRPERFYVPGKSTMWRSGPESKDRDQYVLSVSSTYYRLRLLIRGLPLAMHLDGVADSVPRRKWPKPPFSLHARASCGDST